MTLAVSHPYNQTALRLLKATLEERWPKLDRDEAAYWRSRWLRGVSPYGRVRPHAIRLQLDAIVGLALQAGLRRSEILGLTEYLMHHENTGVLVLASPPDWQGGFRTVPHTQGLRAIVADWLNFRDDLDVAHESPWLNLWSGETLRAPMRADAFHRVLRNYLGPVWTFRRLRDTCAVSWLNAGLPVEHVRRLLGLASIEATLPHAALAKGTLERRMERAGERFALEIAR